MGEPLPVPQPLPARELVLLSLEARARGFRSTLAFRRWCARRGVKIHTEVDGRKQWVCPADVTDAARRAVGLVFMGAGEPAEDPVARALSKLKKGA